MLSPQIVGNNIVGKTYQDLEFKDVLGSAGKCIYINGGSALNFERIKGENFSKALIHLLGVDGVTIKDVYSDGMLNASQDFCKGMMFENCTNVSIDGFISKNIAYGGTSGYKNGDLLLFELNSGISVKRFLLDNAPDGGIDSKSPINAENGTINKVHRGLRLWSGESNVTDVAISNADEGIWLSAGATVILKRVSFKNCIRKVSDDNGNDITNDPSRVTILDSGNPVINPPTFGPTPITPISNKIGWERFKDTGLYRIHIGGRYVLSLVDSPVGFITAAKPTPSPDWVLVK